MKRAVLKPGACIGVIAPAAPAQAARFQAGLAQLEKLGFQVKSPFDPCEYYGRYDYGFSAASKEVRAKALVDLLLDDDIELIITVRGAYGSLEILPEIDFPRIVSAEKPLVGYSDITALLVAFNKLSKVQAIHGPTLSKEFAEYDTSAESRQAVDTLLSMLSAESPQLTLKGNTIRDSEGSGKTIVGNLSMLTCLLGSPWDIDYRGKILLLEESGEAPYRVHRSLMQLLLSGKLDQLAGLAFGRLAHCKAPHGPSVDEVIEKFVAEHLNKTSYPILKDLAFGHHGLNLPIPLGVEAKICDSKVLISKAMEDT